MEINTVTLSGTVGDISTKIIDNNQCSKFTLAIHNGTQYIRVFYWSSVHSKLKLRTGSTIVLNGHLTGTTEVNCDVSLSMTAVVTEKVTVTQY